MGASKKANKRAGGKRGFSSGLGSVLYAFLAVVVAVIALLVLNHLKTKNLDTSAPEGSDHYKATTFDSSVPEEVRRQDALPAEIRDAILPYTEPELHPDKNIRGLPDDLADWPPGERGIGIRLDETKMSEAEKAKRKAMYEKHAFEDYVSELISPDRSLPDFRGDWCRATYDPKRLDLEPTSVVVCFHNEAWSTLVRTVHSLVNRSPANLLEEILLIDDASTMEHLGGRLDEYMARFGDKVRIVRKEERQGLIRCRMLGAQIAKAKVLTFLDSHIEAGVGWLEPLLYRVTDNPKVSFLFFSLSENASCEKKPEKDESRKRTTRKIRNFASAFFLLSPSPGDREPGD